MSDNEPRFPRELAGVAGLESDWQDANGNWRQVSDEHLRSLLALLGLPANSPEECTASARRLAADRAVTGLPGFVTGVVDQPIRVRTGGAATAGRSGTAVVRITLEHGQTLDAVTRLDEDGAMVVPAIRTYGYHTLEWNDHRMTVAVAPERCFGIADAIDPSHLAQRLWGLTTQIYSLRRAEPTGIGDFTALAELAAWSARQGANALGINPVHANFGADTSRYSPYSPSSRLFLNPLYIDPAVTFGATRVRETVARTIGLERWKSMDDAALIAWETVAPARMAVLKDLFGSHATQLNSERLRDLREFRRTQSPALEDHARFEVIDAFYRSTQGISWRQWPAALRDPRSPAVRAFAEANGAAVDFEIFLQWLAHRGLGAAQASARSNGMALGLVYDLAVGTDPTGSHAWSRQGEMIDGLVCGAPPDSYNPLGQSWGLTAFAPEALQRTGYHAFIEMLRAGLRQSGGLRIDHVLGLMRLWLVPEGRPASEGAYLRFPFEDMLRLVALESWRHRAIIIGENLGTVPAGFNDRLSRSGILGTSVLWFEEEFDYHADRAPTVRFRHPNHWPQASAATTTTHDLPTCKGWWAGVDLDWRDTLHLFAPDDSRECQEAHRDEERRALWRALAEAQLVQGEPPGRQHAPVAAMMQFVAKTPAPLALFPLEDVLGESEQPNLPGTTSGHPNWQRRFAQPLERQATAPEVAERIAGVTVERPK